MSIDIIQPMKDFKLELDLYALLTVLGHINKNPRMD